MSARSCLSGHGWRVAGLMPGEWQHLRFPTNPAAQPTHGWVPATVPGHVQADLVDAGRIPDPFVDLGSLAGEWTSARDWAYERRFEASPGPARLRFDGVDIACDVFLNGEHLGHHDGLFAFGFDVELRADNVLMVIVAAAPPSEDELGDTAAVRTWKPRFAYWWDFAPRLVPLGIWGDVWLEAVDGLGDVHVTAAVDAVRVDADARATVTVLDPEGAVVAEGGPGTLTVASPRRWWPLGRGDQALYTVRVSLGEEHVERRVGFRTITFDDLELRVNDEPVPVRGWNCVPVHLFYGRRNDDAYRNLVRRARDAGCNLLRIWGGGILERELFYDLCDEAGILVWQDFLQSSSGRNSEPAVDAAYTAYAVEQATEMVRLRRHHPSLAVWCAGNELATGPDRIPLTDDHPNAAALRTVVQDEDPGRPWLVTTPTGAVPFAQPGVPGLNVHGSYWHLGLDEHERFYRGLDCRFQGEVGCHGAANVDTLRRTITDPWPPGEQWWHKGSWWQRHQHVTDAFGEIDDLEGFVKASQWLQAHGIRAILEAAAARRPTQTGVVLWQLNEPWPNSACSSVVDVFGHAKPGYWAAAEVFRRPDGDGVVEDRWYDALTGSPLPERPVDRLAVRSTGSRQELVWPTTPQPLAPLLTLGGRLALDVDGSQLVVRAVGDVPLHGVLVQTVADHAGPYVDEGWRWFLRPGEAWTVSADGAGDLVVSALNAERMAVAVDPVRDDLRATPP